MGKYDMYDNPPVLKAGIDMGSFDLPRTMRGLMQYALMQGVGESAVKDALKAAGYNKFHAEHWEDYINVVKSIRFEQKGLHNLAREMRPHDRNVVCPVCGGRTFDSLRGKPRSGPLRFRCENDNSAGLRHATIDSIDRLTPGGLSAEQKEYYRTHKPEPKELKQEVSHDRKE